MPAGYKPEPKANQTPPKKEGHQFMFVGHQVDLKGPEIDSRRAGRTSGRGTSLN